MDAPLLVSRKYVPICDEEAFEDAWRSEKSDLEGRTIGGTHIIDYSSL